MSRSARASMWVVAAGAAAGGYLAAVNCPTGWWSSADLRSGRIRIGGGLLVGAIITLLIWYGVMTRP